MTGSWGLLGSSWGLLGPSWRFLGASWGALGSLLEPLGGVLEPLGRLLGRLGGDPKQHKNNMPKKIDFEPYMGPSILIFWPPKPSKMNRMTPHPWRSFFACDVCVVLDRLQDGPRGAQEAPRPPQERPKRLQEAAKSAPGGSKRTSRDPKSRSRDLKTLQDRPKRLQKAPKTLKIAEIAEIDESQRLWPKSQNDKGGRAAVIPLGEVNPPPLACRVAGVLDFFQRSNC